MLEGTPSYTNDKVGRSYINTFLGWDSIESTLGSVEYPPGDSSEYTVDSMESRVDSIESPLHPK